MEVVDVYQLNSYNAKEEQYSDNFFNATLGITLKLGKHDLI
jgi:OOP family OmpA-OmpF porin